MNGMLICTLHGCMVTIWVTWSVLLSKLGTLHIILKALGVVASIAVVYAALGFYIRELFRCTYKRVFQIPMFREDETKIATTEFLMSKKRMMTDQQYNEFLKAYTKEALASMIKADIRSRFPEPYASMYCQQFDNFKNVADFFEFATKLMRR